MGLLLSPKLYPTTPSEIKCKIINELIPFLTRNTSAIMIRIGDFDISEENAIKYINYKYEIERNQTYILNINRDEDEIWKSFNINARRNIRKFEKMGCRIEVDMSNKFINEFYERAIYAFSKNGTKPSFSKKKLKILFKNLAYTEMFVAAKACSPEGEVIGTIVSAGYGISTFLGGYSFKEHYHFFPNEALQWFIIKYWKSKGVIYYDLAGGGNYKEKYRPDKRVVISIRYFKFRIIKKAFECCKKIYYGLRRFLFLKQIR